MKKEIHQVDGKFYEKCPIVILPTENHSDLWKSKFNTYLFEPRQTPLDLIHGGYIAYHLYILSNKEIKEGDWVYDSHLKTVYEVDSILISEGINNDKATKKIITSTDKSLGLARPSNEFLRKFCELNGIWEVLVEYESDFEIEHGVVGELVNHIYNLKVAPDNTITIKPPVQEKLYTRNEVENLLHNLYFDTTTEYNYDRRIFDNWIKEHL